MHAVASSNKLVIPLSKPKNTLEQLSLTVLLGAGLNAPFFLTHREEYSFPKFGFFIPLRTLSEQNRFTVGAGYAKLTLHDSNIEEIFAWASAAFSLASFCTPSGEHNPIYLTRTNNSMTLRLVDVRSHDPLFINIESLAGELRVSVNTDDLETASDLIQDLAAHL